MLYTVPSFLYLVATLIIYWGVSGRIPKKVVLIITSYGFISMFSLSSALFTLIVSVLVYIVGIRIAVKDRAGHVTHSLSIFALVCSLMIAKYLGLFNTILSSLNEENGTGFLQLENVFIPLGISYMVFKYISYLTDIKWGVIGKHDIFDLLAYGSLFTIFFAGPIERFSRLQPQLGNPKPFTDDLVRSNVTRIVWGLIKKITIANWIYQAYVSPGYPSIASIQFIVFLIAYALYIYIDFSAYSDIAIAASGLFGIRIRENFNNPYSAKNITDFWRRWHISLSEWIRDYIFFPLSSLSFSRVWQKLIVPFVAMSVCGIWHGASLYYLYWGMFHGLLIGGYQIAGKKMAKRLWNKSILSTLSANVVLFLVLLISWWLFSRAADYGYTPSHMSLRKLFQLVMILIFTILPGYSERIKEILLIKLKLGDLLIRYSYVFVFIGIIVMILTGTYNSDVSFVYVDF